ncbi:MAG: NADH-quinone oxidoreductase subunit J [Acidimicrobiia bacterium]|nr:NADH-quinone oxidoreductase subunit J [Acidimicrobiia bacterium]
MAELIIFVLMAVAAIAGAVAVVLARNPVYAAMGLLGSMLALAVLYVAQLAHFVAAIQVVVYAGAVMTLFLFVVMLIGVDRVEDTSEKLPFQRQLVAVGLLGVTAIAIAVAVSNRFTWVIASSGELIPQASNGTTVALARVLFSDWVLAFESTALLLTIASAGAIALASRRGKPLDLPGDDLVPVDEEVTGQ